MLPATTALRQSDRASTICKAYVSLGATLQLAHSQQSSSPDFSSLQELVTFHKQKRAGLTSTLKDPCPKEVQAKFVCMGYHGNS